MFLHIGSGEIIAEEDIIGIFDMDTATVSKSTGKFLSSAEKKKRVIYTDSEIPKSFVVCKERKGKKEKIFFSRISSTALKMRVGRFLEDEQL